MVPQHGGPSTRARKHTPDLLELVAGAHWLRSCRCAGRRPGPDGGEADDAAAADGGRPAVARAGGELHGKINSFVQ